MNKLALSIIESVPDWIDSNHIQKWIQTGITNIIELNNTEIQNTFTSIRWDDIKSNHNSRVGLYSCDRWRKFVLAIFLADIRCYSHSVNQVNFDRLSFVVHHFPQGFRIWWCKNSTCSWWPIGYTAWHPMHEAQFNIFEYTPYLIKDRFVLPKTSNQSQGDYIYLFNYSIISSLKKSSISKLLIKTYADDVLVNKIRGLSCITVSQEGENVARQFGMNPSGQFKIELSYETIYINRIQSSSQEKA